MLKFIGLDNKNYNLDTKQSSYPLRNESASKSKIQYSCGQILKKKFPLCPILEEVSIPGHNLIFDFFLPIHKIAVEVQGEQHKTHNKFFHKTVKAFHDAQDRDDAKQLLCDKNNWILISVESPEELTECLGLPQTK